MQMINYLTTDFDLENILRCEYVATKVKSSKLGILY